MALEPVNLLQPEGELEHDLFADTDPGGGTEERVAVWLEQGKAKALADAIPTGSVDAAVAAWVYYRAYKAKAARMSQLITSGSMKVGSVAWAKDQRDEFRGLAAKWEAEYEALVPAEQEQSFAVPVSRSIPVRSVWRGR